MPHLPSPSKSPDMPPKQGDRQERRRSSSHRLVMLPRPEEDKKDSHNNNNSNNNNNNSSNNNSSNNETGNQNSNEQGSSSKPKNPDIQIPSIHPIDHGESLASRAEGLVGKFVDEFGNILDWDGTVLGSVEGDLPSMVGRPVSESGEILDAAGEVVGYVSENHTKPTLRDLEGGLRIDGDGNIYNKKGEVVGKMNKPSTGEKQGESSGQQSKGEGKAPNDAGKTNASTPSPSDVFLDVKSTHDGIQLIIRIPTVFRSER